MSTRTPPQQIQQLFAAAATHHQNGRLAEAEPLYQQVLAADPNHLEVLHLLGMLMHQTGRSAPGLELIRKSVSLKPTFASLSNLGEVLRATGKTDEAIATLRKAAELNPNSADVFSNLGRALMDHLKVDEAEKAFSRACQLAPNRADVHIRLCLVRTDQGDPHGAAQAGRRAVELQPSMPEAWSNLALALAEGKKHEEAIAAARRAVTLAPQRAETHYTLARALAAAEQRPEAESEYLRAIELNPKFSLAHRQLAALYDFMNDFPRSIASVERALALQPRDVKAWVNLSTLRRRTNDNRGALEAAEQAMKHDPSSPDAHGNIAMALLALGDYPRGFAEYEWRWRCDSFTTKPRDWAGSTWDGSDPAGRTILVHTEQGFGDTIQFVRYVPMLASRGAKVILESWPSLLTLMPRVKGVNRVIAVGVHPPQFDLHVALLSLPKLFKTTLDTVPAEVPYLFADPERVEVWKRKIEALGDGLKVGLIWAGNIKPDPFRTCPIQNLAPLGRVPGVKFISLQKRNNPLGAEPPPEGLSFVDVSEDLRDFGETAAAMKNLDLIITIDTGACHLAGALGCPTWAMLPWAGDWRWLEDREDTPWYPTMRLFRQPAREQWLPVAERVAEELSALASRQAGSKKG
jgi:tetratricopeptide (TPR) repeat protein